jgi:pyruvate dehydrogenase E2 component (dihydrolipoamide acetyltransferase)
MPVLGLTMEEGTVAEWLKAEGDAVAKDEPLLTVEMDKGTVEVPSPAAGILRRIVVQQGTTVPIRTLIAEIGDRNEVTAPPAGPSGASSGGLSVDSVPSPAAASQMGATASAAGRPATASPAGGPGDLPPSARARPVNTIGAAASSSSTHDGGRRLFASPRARMRARAIGLDLTTLAGSGPNGRIVESDVLAASATELEVAPSDSRVLITPVARRLAQEHGVAIADLVGTGPGGRITQDDVLRVADQRAPAAAGAPAYQAAEHMAAAEPAHAGVAPLSRVRRITAERMAASAQATARVTLFLEADFSEAARFRSQLQPEFARLGTPKLPWDALIAKAAALALVDHPAVAAQWVDGQGLRQSEAAHLGIGVAVTLEPEGLVVPVLKDADARSLRELATDLLALVDKARAGRLSPVEMHGGTFTITNLGAYGIDGFTPIINPPETAILGVGRIADKPVVVDGKIEARTMCTLSLSFDHRVVDGAPAAALLARLGELLERPYALLGI